MVFARDEKESEEDHRADGKQSGTGCYQTCLTQLAAKADSVCVVVSKGELANSASMAFAMRGEFIWIIHHAARTSRSGLSRGRELFPRNSPTGTKNWVSVILGALAVVNAGQIELPGAAAVKRGLNGNCDRQFSSRNRFGPFWHRRWRPGGPSES